MKRCVVILTALVALPLSMANQCPATPEMLETFEFARNFFDENEYVLMAWPMPNSTGVLNIATGKITVPPKYNDLLFSREGVVVSHDELWGVVDREGKEIVPLQYTEIAEFQDALAPFANADGQWGALDRTGKVVIPAQFDYLQLFVDGKAAASKGEKWGVVDRQGQWLIPPEYEYAATWQGGYLLTMRGAEARLFNAQGQEIAMLSDPDASIEYAYAAEGFVAGIVGVSGGETLIDREGKEVLPTDPEQRLGAFDPESGRIRVYREDTGEAFFLNAAGEKVGDTYAGATDFAEGLAGVKVGDKWGFMNVQGEMVIAPQFADATAFAAGTASVQQEDGLWYLINKEGKVLSAGYDVIDDDIGGYRQVEKAQQYGLIDRAGREVLAPQYQEIVSAYPENGRVLAKKDDLWQIIDAQGCVYAIQDGSKG